MGDLAPAPACEPRAEARGRLDAMTVCISGCPNGCAQSAVAGVGLVGGLATRDGQRTEVYNLFAGGQMGRTPQLAATIARRIDAGQVLAAVAQRLSADEVIDLLRDRADRFRCGRPSSDRIIR